LADVREVKIDVGHHGIVAILASDGAVRFGVIQELLAEVTVGRCESIVEAVEIREAEAPIEVVGLDGVGDALDVERELIENNRVRGLRVGGRRVGVRAEVGRADIPANVDPTVELNVLTLEPIVAFTAVDCLCQRIVGGVRVTDPGCAADGPDGEGEWRIVDRSWVAAIGGGGPVETSCQSFE